MFVALVIQHAKLMRLMSCVSYTAIAYFPKLSHKRHYFRKTVTGHKNACFRFSTTSVWNISHSKKDSVRYHKCKYVFMYSAAYFCQSLTNLGIFSVNFRKILIKLRENSSRGSRVFPRRRTDGWTDTDGQTDRRTDMTKLTVSFRIFANAPNMRTEVTQCTCK
jgi:hypothetical protein